MVNGTFFFIYLAKYCNKPAKKNTNLPTDNIIVTGSYAHLSKICIIIDKEQKKIFADRNIKKDSLFAASLSKPFFSDNNSILQ